MSVSRGKLGFNLKYKDLLSGLPHLLEKIELNFKDSADHLEKLDQHETLFSGKHFEIIPFRTDRKTKSLYVIIKENLERISHVYHKKLSNIHEETLVINPTEDMNAAVEISSKKNIKDLLKNKVKNIKTLVTLSALKSTLVSAFYFS